MNGAEFLDKMGLVDAAFVAEADEIPVKKRHFRARWGALAAAFCLVALGALSLWGLDRIPTPPSDPEPIPIPDLVMGGFGFEGYLYYDPSQLTVRGPWQEDTELTTLPVYQNNAYDPSGAGVPRGLDEAEMGAILADAAHALGLDILSTEPVTEPVVDEEPLLTGLRAQTDNGQLHVLGDGSLVYTLPGDGLALPDGYSFTWSDTTDSQALESVTYLTKVYSALLDMEAPTAATWGSYNFHGDFHRSYAVYDAGGDAAAALVSYHLSPVTFSASFYGTLSAIRVSNSLLTAEKLGDYPVISAEEAEQRLLAGNYQTSVPHAMPGKEYVTMVELVYRAGPFEELLIPYYRFYVHLPDQEPQDSALQCYGTYYVPALAEAYMENMPVYDGHFS